MKLVLDDGTEYHIQKVKDVQIVREITVKLWADIELKEMMPETVLAFVRKVLPEVKA
jgi:hypothetical protein